KDRLHGDHWDVMDKKGKKIKEIDFDELENNQDIELKTAPEYVIGYLVEKLRNKDLLLLEKTIKVAAKANNDRE
ncbi:1416_t:CDS:2, partial [Ambispora leptoticha]